MAHGPDISNPAMSATRHPPTHPASFPPSAQADCVFSKEPSGKHPLLEVRKSRPDSGAAAGHAAPRVRARVDMGGTWGSFSLLTGRQGNIMAKENLLVVLRRARHPGVVQFRTEASPPWACILRMPSHLTGSPLGLLRLIALCSHSVWYPVSVFAPRIATCASECPREHPVMSFDTVRLRV